MRGHRARETHSGRLQLGQGHQEGSEERMPGLRSGQKAGSGDSSGAVTASSNPVQERMPEWADGTVMADTLTGSSLLVSCETQGDSRVGRGGKGAEVLCSRLHHPQSEGAGETWCGDAKNHHSHPTGFQGPQQFFLQTCHSLSESYDPCQPLFINDDRGGRHQRRAWLSRDTFRLSGAETVES